MKKETRPDCDIGLVIRSVVDEGDLDADQRRHLAECPVCREERRRLAHDLDRLGRRAEEYTPGPARKPVLPGEHRAPSHRPASGWQLAWGAAAGFALVMLVAVWMVYRGPGATVDYQEVAREMAEDEMLLAEVLTLVENPLPDAYREISPEDAAGIDEDIFDFIVPVDSGTQEEDSRGKEV